MMAYKALCRFRDLEDRHLYDAGDEFPHDGRGISPARIAELSGDKNKAGFALIEADGNAGMETETPKPAAKARQRAAKTAKKEK